MVLLVKVAAIAIIVYGCSLMLRPEILRKMASWAQKGNNLFLLNILKIFFGVLLMLASGSVAVPWVVMFLGALAAFSGALAFVVKRNLLQDLVEWIEGMPPRTIYIVGVVSLAIGALLAIAA
ncbi:MAG: hypothetical protein GF392_00025 [Candidatus Omnitrophica bacterium]|nr:hypothetical protein [Candidatus Omnitrophota bacterium]